MPPPNHRSGEHDAALILAIRQEVEAALLPVREKLESIDGRLALGDTKIALFDQRLGGVETQCSRHRTDRMEKKKDMNPILLALISGAVGSVGSVVALWFLIGVGQQAAKGTP